MQPAYMRHIIASEPIEQNWFVCRSSETDENNEKGEGKQSER
jgi:hypothetical protein